MVGVMAATWHQGSRWNAIGSVLKTPAIIAVIPAVVVNLLDIQSPLFIQRAVSVLAAAMIPIMLLTLGVQLSGMGRPRIGRDVVVASSIRLVVGPILAVALAALIGLSGVARGAGILQVSMPSAVLAALVALEHDLVPNFVTTTVLFSTLASAVTLTIVLALI
jgi:predicted permease